MKTADGVEITHGLRVWDYDLRSGVVDLSRGVVQDPALLTKDDWFFVRHGAGSSSYMNAERVTTRHPFTEVPA